METTINDKTVRIITSDNWVYDGIGWDKIQSINPDLFETVQKEVDYFIKNRETILQEKKEQEEKEKFKLNLAKYTKFKTEILTDHKEELKNYEVKFFEPRETREYSYNPQRFEINGFEIYYDNEVVSPGAWRASKTNKVWVLCTRDYKRIRYSSLKNAIKKCLQRVEDHKEEQHRKNLIEASKVKEHNKLQEYADTHGFKLDSESHYSKYNYITYYTYYLVKGNLKARITYNKEKDKVIIFEYSVKKEGTTIEELKQAAKEVQ